MKHKKVVSCLTTAVMTISLLLPGNNALAKEVDESTEAEAAQEIIVQSLIGIKQGVEFEISGKTAKFTVFASGVVATKKIAVTAKLQRNVSGKWKDIQSWNKTSEESYLTLKESTSLSSKGSYRVQATVTYYQKDSKETKTVTSVTKTYS